MPAPASYFVREWIVDPDGEGPDAQHDRDERTEESALARAKTLRDRGRQAGAFARVNIRRPGLAGDDLPWFLWEWDEKWLDEEKALDEIAEAEPRTNAARNTR